MYKLYLYSNQNEKENSLYFGCGKSGHIKIFYLQARGRTNERNKKTHYYNSYSKSKKRINKITENSEDDDENENNFNNVFLRQNIYSFRRQTVIIRRVIY